MTSRNVGGGDGPGKLNRLATVEALTEKEKKSWPWIHTGRYHL